MERRGYAARVSDGATAEGRQRAGNSEPAPSSGETRRRRERRRRSMWRRWYRQNAKNLWIYALAIVLSASVTYVMLRERAQ